MTTLGSKLDLFISEILVDKNVIACARRWDDEHYSGERLLHTYANEARVGLALIEPVIQPDQRILEVGSGIGVLGLFLHENGFNLVGIEPGAKGFGFMPDVGKAIRRSRNMEAEAWLTIAAEELRPQLHGSFDLIYSVNVLEHILALDQALASMSRVLSEKGRMVHMCPNYFIPYEPHFSIPLLPFAPSLTRFLFPNRVKRLPGLWDELNFITASKLNKIADKYSLEVEYDDDVLLSIFQRMETDKIFKERQVGISSFIYNFIRFLSLTKLLSQIPGRFASPMVARLAHMGQNTDQIGSL